MGALGQQQSRAGMSIGSVLDLLRPEYPDITISKIRFLEAEGLISPERTPSGYRRFSEADCARLRFVLAAQRDQYLPLKVIREQLDALDSGAVPAIVRPASGRPLTIAPAHVAPDDFRAGAQTRISRADLLERTGADEPFLTELIRGGLITPGAAGYFDENAVAIAASAIAMAAFGLEVRHLRAFKLAADREAALAAQIAGPIARGRDSGARDRAEETVRELAALSLTLHTALVKAAVQTALG